MVLRYSIRREANDDMRHAFVRVSNHMEVLRRALRMTHVVGAPPGLRGTVNLSLLTVLALIGFLGVHFLTGGGLIPKNHLQCVMQAGTALASVWLCLALFRAWMGWGVRQMYAGPICGDLPADPLWTVCLYRVGIAAGWTVIVVAVMLVLSLLGHGGKISTVLFTTESKAWLTEYGWWVAFVTFAWSTERQLERIWDDLNRATLEQ